jgi:hypothetical protein
MIVPYISKPPIIDITAAPPAIWAECHSKVGKATKTLESAVQVPFFSWPARPPAATCGDTKPGGALTDSHYDEESR